MSDSGRTNRPSASSSAGGQPKAAEPTKVFRSLKPGELGPARMNPVNEERSAAASQIQRTMKAWRAASGGGGAGQAGVPKGSGAPLASSIRSRMEPKLGASLGSVRVHTGSESAEAAKGFGARAFTVGEDVHFNAGEFQPGTKEGDKLLAHELTHVVQGQKSGIQRKPEGDDKGGGDKGAGEGGGEGGGEAKGGAEVSDPNEPAEKEADATGDKVGEELHGGGDEKGEKGGKDKKDKDKKGGDKKDAKGGEGKGEGKEGEKGEGKEGAGEKGEGKEGGGDKGEGKEGGGDKGAADKGPEEKPAPVAAKLEGVGLKVFRAPPPTNPAANAGPKKPQNDGEYQALPGFSQFNTNCVSIGVTPAEALGFWKGVMDQLFANQDQVKKLAGNKDAILAYVDAAGQRGGFTSMADAMLLKFPLDMTKEYALWSGKNAEVYAGSQGCVVLEATGLGTLFNKVTTAFSSHWDCMQGLWRAISDAYAKKIATIMLGKPIKVFVRKKGDIFAQVESGAIAQVQQKVNAKPTFNFHAIHCEGTFSNESGYDGTPNNSDTRKELVTMADLPKATTASKGKGLRIFDFGPDAPVPATELKDVGGVSGDAAQVDAAVGLLSGHNTTTQGKVDAVKAQLKAAKKP